MAISYVLTPLSSIQYVPFDASNSNPIVINGQTITTLNYMPYAKMYTFKSTEPTTPKATYQDMGGKIPHTNPVRADAGGRFPLIYFETGGTERYYVKFTDQNDKFIDDADHYPPDTSGSSPPVTTEIDFTNHVLNGQFRYWRPREDDTLTDTEMYIADAGWTFRKSNTNGTDTIDFLEFNPGQIAVPFNPKYYFEYNCTAIGGGGETYKDAICDVGDVISFENTQITIQLVGWSPGSSTIEAYWIQDFGTGGSADVPTLISAYALTPTETKYYTTLVIPTTGGKTIGKGNRAILAIRMPLNAISTINAVNFAINLGDKALDYEYFTSKQESIRTKAVALPRIIEPTSSGSLKKILPGSYMSTDTDLNAVWYRKVGKYNFYPYGAIDTDSEHKCDGSSKFHEDDEDLWDKIGNGYGHGEEGFWTSVDSAVVHAVNQTGGPVTDMVDGASPTGFVFNKIQDGVDYNFYSQPSHSGSLVAKSDGLGHFIRFNNDNNGCITSVGSGTVGFGILITPGTASLPKEIILETVASASASSYFTIDTVNEDYYTWFKKDGTGTDPAVVGRTGILVELLSTDTNEEARDKILYTLTGSGGINVNSEFVYIKNTTNGKVTAADPGTSQFAINIIQPGVVGLKPQIQAIIVHEGSKFTGPAVAVYFEVDSSTTSYYIWCPVDGTGTDPAVSGKTGIKVDLLSSDTRLDVARKIAHVLNGCEITDITCGDASTLSSGDFFKLYGPSQDYYADVVKDGNEVDPDLSAHKRLKIEITTGQTDAQVAAIVSTAISRAQFQVPDLRGLGVRGFNDSRELIEGILQIDVDADYRQTSKDYITEGNNIGTTQLDSFRSHNHKIRATGTGGAQQVPILGLTNAIINSEYTGSSETRMTNMSVLFTINR